MQDAGSAPSTRRRRHSRTPEMNLPGFLDSPRLAWSLTTPVELGTALRLHRSGAAGARRDFRTLAIIGSARALALAHARVTVHCAVLRAALDRQRCREGSSARRRRRG